MLRAADFAGMWRIDRVIEDALGPEAHFHGTAIFQASGSGLDYAEAGKLKIAGSVLQAERRWHWAFGPEGVSVTYPDGRPFHAFTWVGGEADHLCAADLYRVAYDFSAFPEWQARWRVTGPKKDYVSRSRYTRLPLGEGSGKSRTENFNVGRLE